MITMDNEEIYNTIITKLNEVQDILTKEIDPTLPGTDLDVWNATPVGRVMNRLTDIGDLLQELELT